MKKANWKRAYRQAAEVFDRTRDYENNIAATKTSDYRLRWVVRYHVLLHAGDYSWIDKFGRPRSRRALIALCNEALADIEKAWKGLCVYDSNRQYFEQRAFLKRLRFAAEHFPLLFYIKFRPLLRWARKHVAVRQSLG